MPKHTEEKKKEFRVNAKKLFITWSQCEASKEAALELCKRVAFVVNYAIGQEDHAPKEGDDHGGKHLHAAIWFNSKINLTTCNQFILEGRHPHIEGIKNWKNCTAYCKKDGDFIESHNFDWDDDDKYCMRKRDYLTMLADKQHKLDVIEHKERMNKKIKELRPWQEDLKKVLEGDVEERKVYWIWSEESNTGKSTFMNWLDAQGIPVLAVNNEKWDDTLHAYKREKVLHVNIERESLEAGSVGRKVIVLLEHISDNPRFYTSTKYDSTKKYVKAHIVVTANCPPPFERLPERCIEIKATL